MMDHQRVKDQVDSTAAWRPGEGIAADMDTRLGILRAIPQQAPFRFIDEILDLDENRIKGTYRFQADEFFYKGHFPGRPITPGVILIETMAQTGIAGLGIYNIMLERKLGLEEMNDLLTLFSYVEEVEFLTPVLPGDRVIVYGEKMYYRRGNLKARASIEHEDGRPVCHGILAGIEKLRSA